MKRTAAVERFWPKVRVLGPDDCWLWTSATKGVQGKQYGNFWIGEPGRPYVGAHVFAWELVHGPVPKGQWVLHSCDVMLCANERHLFLGSVLDNNLDMMRKDRVPFGERHWNAKLETDDIGLIVLRAEGGEQLSVIASDYGVAWSHIYNIVRGKAWRRAPRGFDARKEYDALCDAVRDGLVDLKYLGQALRSAAAHREIPS